MTSPRRPSPQQSRRPPKIRMRPNKIALAAFAGLAILQSRDAQSAVRRWIGLGDATWNDLGNWLLGNIPAIFRAERVMRNNGGSVGRPMSSFEAA